MKSRGCQFDSGSESAAKLRATGQLRHAQTVATLLTSAIISVVIAVANLSEHGAVGHSVGCNFCGLRIIGGGKTRRRVVRQGRRNGTYSRNLQIDKQWIRVLSDARRDTVC